MVHSPHFTTADPKLTFNAWLCWSCCASAGHQRVSSLTCVTLSRPRLAAPLLHSCCLALPPVLCAVVSLSAMRSIRLHSKTTPDAVVRLSPRIAEKEHLERRYCGCNKLCNYRHKKTRHQLRIWMQHRREHHLGSCRKKPGQGRWADDCPQPACKPHGFVLLAVVSASCCPRRNRAP